MIKLFILFRNMFPDNIVQATFQQVETEYREIRPVMNSTTIAVQAVHRHMDGMNALGGSNKVGVETAKSSAFKG